jgi:hypothetical protein
LFRSDENPPGLINRNILRVRRWGSARSVRFHGSVGCGRKKKYFSSQEGAKNELELLPFVSVAFHFPL